MKRMLTLALLAVVAVAAPASATEIKGQYVEARTCEVWTGPCFANADFNLTGKNAMLVWRVDTGSLNGVKLDGLTVVAVIATNETLGLKQSSAAKVVLIVDDKADTAQRAALVQLAKQQGAELFGDVLAVHAVPIELTICECKGETCAELKAGNARLKTRCIDANHDKACGNEIAFYPPLTRGTQVRAAAAVENVWNGTGLGQNWGDFDRRGAYVGTFVAR